MADSPHTAAPMGDRVTFRYPLHPERVRQIEKEMNGPRPLDPVPDAWRPRYDRYESRYHQTER